MRFFDALSAENTEVGPFFFFGPSVRGIRPVVNGEMTTGLLLGKTDFRVFCEFRGRLSNVLWFLGAICRWMRRLSAMGASAPTPFKVFFYIIVYNGSGCFFLIKFFIMGLNSYFSSFL